ncbi:amidase family protein [Hydrocarboniphaga effusa]|uniref:amidase family protein n=1 Tax=Hydrocarboniphaga effusa TaxID=243629 RepID=UPI00398BF977
MLASRLFASTALACALALSFPAANAATLDISTASITEVQAAFSQGLTSQKLLDAYLKRIEAYDKKGPTINAVILLNPKAKAEAQKLDAERKAGKIRGPLHGIPVILKDNYDTFDLQTTGGSQLLLGSVPPDDAFVVKKLREAGAIIVAKVNLSEWAGGGGSVSGATDPLVLERGAVPNGSSTAGGQTRNPHDLSRGPAGSSGGTGAGLAAAFAQFGLGTDTGGSIRSPSSVNGIAGLKPTRGLLSRDGIIPLALSFDTGGPMARNVTDVAISLGAMTGVDAADAATKPSAGQFKTDYTPYLKTGSLKGARIGVARDFFGQDAEVDRVMEASIATLKKLGATVIDVRYPSYMLGMRQPGYSLIMASEFKAQVTDYLGTLKPGFPKTFDDVVRLSNDPKTKYRQPEKAYALTYTATQALDLDDPIYLVAKNEGLALVKASVDAVLSSNKLDAIVYATNPRPAQPIDPKAAPAGAANSPTNIANQTGYPDLIVPAGITKDGLPVTISFFGPAWSEPKLLGYGYDFEQATHARVLPKNTPSLPSDRIEF